MPCTTDILPLAANYVPPVWSLLPFAALLLAIAVLPLIGHCHHFWERNRNKLLVALALSVPVLLYYGLVHPGMAGHDAEPHAARTGGALLLHVLSSALLEEYLPFIVLLFSLYTISGGIQLRGDLPAHPGMNTTFLAIGAVLASLIGTTGAAMLLIRPLLQTNAERRHARHTVIFFIFIVCNTGGLLLPTGDPPLFLGYLRGVPFLWTTGLWPEWLLVNGLLLAIYYFWDRRAYRHEAVRDLVRDETHIQPLQLRGRVNLLYLLGVVLAVATLVPGKEFILLSGVVVPDHVREIVILALVGLSMLTTPRGLRKENGFTFAAIGEVAALFLGIFITMQPPIEMLHVKGPALGLLQPWQFFWATGSLSSFLDNAPTYVVFFETASALTPSQEPGTLALVTGGFIRQDLLVAISLGAVFMGAMTYIGNGPNFMVKAVAQERGVKMPSFLGYMVYSVLVLIPVFVLVTFVFLLWR